MYVNIAISLKASEWINNSSGKTFRLRWRSAIKIPLQPFEKFTYTVSVRHEFADVIASTNTRCCLYRSHSIATVALSTGKKGNNIIMTDVMKVKYNRCIQSPVHINSPLIRVIYLSILFNNSQLSLTKLIKTLTSGVAIYENLNRFRTCDDRSRHLVLNNHVVIITGGELMSMCIIIMQNFY